MEDLYEQLHALKDGAGDFACSGCLPKLPLPGLFVENVGYIALPIQEEQANKIIAVAKKAPFGLGEKTLVDETVRKSWQLDPNEVLIKNDVFNQEVKNLVVVVKEQLGCNDKAVEAYLYKVLLYEKGGHFLPHRDTEKENGMFATMVVQLPSVFEGGKLIVRHRGSVKEVRFDDEESSYYSKYAAHYSDCEHEVTEITSGYRLALVYSLCWNATSAPPSAAASGAVLQNIAEILPTVCTEERKMFCWFLGHKYSSAGLSGKGTKGLKGHDAAVANALQAANQLLPDEEKFDFHIAMVTRKLEQYGDCYRGRWGDDGDFEPNGDEMEEISVECEWFKLNGARQNMKSMEVDFEDEVVNYLCPPGMTSEKYKDEFWGDADDEHNTGPTGNAGATQTYWYRNYAIFAWPKANSVHLMCKNGYQSAVEWLANEFSQVKGLPVTHAAYEKALSHLNIVLNFALSKPISLNANVVCSMLAILKELPAEASVGMVNLFLTGVLAKEVSQHSWLSVKSRYCLGDDAIIPSLVCLVVAVGWQSISDAILNMFQMSPVSQHGRWAVFLKKLLENMNETRKTALSENECFNSLLVSLVDAVEASATSKTLDSTTDAIAWVGKTAALLFLFNNTELLNKFTDAVLAFSNQSPNSSLLENLIETLPSEDLACALPFWLKLLLARIKQLEKVEKLGVQTFSWNQDNAVITGHPLVQAFLRGPNQSTTYQAFSGIKHARNWASKHFGNSSWYGSNSSRTYSAKVTTGGTGQKAYALIEKTRAWYDKQVSVIQRQLKDLTKLRGMVNTLTNNEDLTTEDLEPAPKRRAVATICLD